MCYTRVSYLSARRCIVGQFIVWVRQPECGQLAEIVKRITLDVLLTM